MNVRQFIIYAPVAGSCMLLNIASLIAMHRVGMNLLLSAIVSYAIVVVFGYILHSKLTFRQPIALHAFLRYAGSMAINIPLTFLLLNLWCNVIGLAMAYAAPCTTICATLTNFLFSRWAIMNRSGGSKMRWAIR